MAITHVASQASSGAPTTTFTLTIPSGTTTNDILIVSLVSRGGLGTITIVDDDTGGNTYALVGSSGTLAVYWKRATSATASKTITVDGAVNSSCGGVSVYRGCSTGTTPYENVTAQSNAAGTESVTGVTPTRDGSLLCMTIGNVAANAVSSQSVTTPGALQERFDASSTGGSDSACAHASEVQTTATASGNFTWSQTDGTTRSCVFDLLALVSNLTADVAAFTLSGQDASLLWTQLITADVAAFTLSAQDANLLAARTITADVAAFTLAAQDADLLWTQILVAEVAEFTLTGQDIILLKVITFAADAAAFTLTAQDADLFWLQVLDVGVGSFTLTGQDANLVWAQLLDAAAASFTLTGQDASLLWGHAIVADVGAFVLTGQDASLLPARVIVADVGSFTLTGQDISLLTGDRILSVDAASFTLTGYDVTFTIGRPPCPGPPERPDEDTSVFYVRSDDVLVARSRPDESYGTMTRTEDVTVTRSRPDESVPTRSRPDECCR